MGLRACLSHWFFCHGLAFLTGMIVGVNFLARRYHRSPHLHPHQHACINHVNNFMVAIALNQRHATDSKSSFQNLC